MVKGGNPLNRAAEISKFFWIGECIFILGLRDLSLRNSILRFWALCWFFKILYRGAIDAVSTIVR
jgi:hypothetical protein